MHATPLPENVDPQHEQVSDFTPNVICRHVHCIIESVLSSTNYLYFIYYSVKIRGGVKISIVTKDYDIAGSTTIIVGIEIC